VEETGVPGDSWPLPKLRNFGILTPVRNKIPKLDERYKKK